MLQPISGRTRERIYRAQQRGMSVTKGARKTGVARSTFSRYIDLAHMEPNYPDKKPVTYIGCIRYISKEIGHPYFTKLLVLDEKPFIIRFKKRFEKYLKEAFLELCGKEILRLRYAGDEHRTYEEVGRIIGTTGSNVKLMEDHALEKLKHPCNIEKLDRIMRKRRRYRYNNSDFPGRSTMKTMYLASLGDRRLKEIYEHKYRSLQLSELHHIDHAFYDEIRTRPFYRGLVN